MRLWHQNLIEYLPRQQILGLHRELCALRGNGWGKSHSIVNYVFKYDRIKLYQYHYLVMREMIRRGYDVDPNWWIIGYRGKQCTADKVTDEQIEHVTGWISGHAGLVYQEHNIEYLIECLRNLTDKNIYLKIA